MPKRFTVDVAVHLYAHIAVERTYCLGVCANEVRLRRYHYLLEQPVVAVAGRSASRCGMPVVEMNGRRRQIVGGVGCLAGRCRKLETADVVYSVVAGEALNFIAIIS